MTAARAAVVLHYFPRAGACAIQAETVLRAGDAVLVRGHTTDFTTRVERIELDHARIARAEPGATVAMQVPDRVRKGDVIYRLSEPKPGAAR
jgi:translation elongation factor EF-1alpha